MAKDKGPGHKDHGTKSDDILVATTGNDRMSGRSGNDILYVSRTRFPWTQNWLNRSVQGGPEHDR